MTKSFNRFKNKIYFEVIIKALIVAISCGIFTASILILLIKNKIIDFKVLYSIGIGFGIFMVIFIILFILFKPNNVKTAKRLDNQLELKEKIHTMIEFKDDNEYLKNIQRNDAIKKLDNIPTKSLKMKFHFIYLIIPFVALSLLVTTIVIPTKAEEPPYIEPGESTNKAVFKQIEALIKHVKDNEKIDDNTKQTYILELGNLITALDVVDISRNQEIIIVQTTINNVNNYVLQNSVISEISDSLSGSNIDYIQSIKIALDNYDPNDETIINEIDEAFVKISASLKVNSQSGRIEQLASIRSEFFNKIKSIQGNSSIKTIISELDEKCESAVRESTYATLIDEAFVDSKIKIFNFFATEYYNGEEAVFIEDSLRSIFSLPKRENGGSDDDNPGGEIDDPSHSGGNESGSDNPGGGGDGTLNGGSDIIFYDPELGYVKCTPEVLAKYLNRIESLLNDGVISQETYDIYYTYYVKLSNTEN
ncbi:MAG: hypothetical protein ACI35S_04230 [Anaeroplasma sp.]